MKPFSFLVPNPAIYRSQLAGGKGSLGLPFHFTNQSLRPVSHNEILNNLFPLHHLLQRPNHCSLGVLLMCQLSACSKMLLPNSTCSKLNLLWEQGQILNCSQADGQHGNASCHFSGSTIRDINWGNKIPFPYFILEHLEV